MALVKICGCSYCNKAPRESLEPCSKCGTLHNALGCCAHDLTGMMGRRWCNSFGDYATVIEEKPLEIGCSFKEFKERYSI